MEKYLLNLNMAKLKMKIFLDKKKQKVTTYKKFLSHNRNKFFLLSRERSI